MACRSVADGEKVAAKLRAALPADAGRLEVAAIDLADLESVRAYCTTFLASGRGLDLLINNAGVMARPLTLTAQGTESQLGINHLGHFALTLGLLPVLATKGRVINIASGVHTRGKAEHLLVCGSQASGLSPPLDEGTGRITPMRGKSVIPPQSQFGPDRAVIPS